MVANTGSEFADRHLKPALFEPAQTIELVSPFPDQPQFQIKTLTPGATIAPLTGGNLSLLAAMCGTPDQLIGKNKLVFIEDVSEDPYRIDRMLTQLIQCGCLEGAKGIICGQFTRCDPENPDDKEWLVANVLQDLLTPLKIPAITGAATGHVKDQWTMPIGRLAELNADLGTLKLLA
jgi:muramoyltetrapeptide carboxypeptidase